MPKWNSSYDSSRNYQPAWETSLAGLRKADKSSDAWCKLCNVTIQSKLCTIKKHGESTKHRERDKKGTEQTRISLTKSAQTSVLTKK